MKKFLTVLLALSVVFTYSFSAVGTAFAATTPTASDVQEELYGVISDYEQDLKGNIDRVVKKFIENDSTIDVTNDDYDKTVKKAAIKEGAAAYVEDLVKEMKEIADKAIENANKGEIVVVADVKAKIDGIIIGVNAEEAYYEYTPVAEGELKTAQSVEGLAEKNDEGVYVPAITDFARDGIDYVKMAKYPLSSGDNIPVGILIFDGEKYVSPKDSTASADVTYYRVEGAGKIELGDKFADLDKDYFIDEAGNKATGYAQPNTLYYTREEVPADPGLDLTNIDDFAEALAATDYVVKAEAPLSEAYWTAEIEANYPLANYAADNGEYTYDGVTKLTAQETVEAIKADALKAIADAKKTLAEDKNYAKAIAAYETAYKSIATEINKLGIKTNEEIEDDATTVEEIIKLEIAKLNAYAIGEFSDHIWGANFKTPVGDATVSLADTWLDFFDEDIYKTKANSKSATIFGVEVKDTTEATRAEVLAVKSAYNKAISETVTAVEAAIKATAKTPKDIDMSKYYVTDALGSSQNIGVFVETVNKAYGVTAKYDAVVARGEALKKAEKAGVKLYDDAKVDAVVAEAKTAVYADMGQESVETYFKNAINKVYDKTYTSYEGALAELLLTADYEYDKLMAAIDEAKEKFQARVTTIGSNATPEADKKYCKNYYAVNAKNAEGKTYGALYEVIKTDAHTALDEAQSYADIEAAMKAADSELAKLMLAVDQTSVEAARAAYAKAFADDIEAYKDILDDKVGDYSKALGKVQTAGNALINDAITVDAVKAAYADAKALFDTLKTDDELEKMAEDLDKLLRELPLASKVTAADAEKIEAAREAFDAYEAVIGTETVILGESRLTAAEKALYTIEKEALEAEIKALNDKLAKIDFASEDVAVKELLALKDEMTALAEKAEAFNDKMEEKEITLAVDADKIVAGLSMAEGSVWRAEVEMTISAILKALNSEAINMADVNAAFDAYKALTDRQQYLVDKKTNYAVETIKAKMIAEVEGLKITASSKAAKGSMTINWKVKGDASAADGFRVYRSKKMNSGYGKTYYFQTKDNTKRSYKNTKELKKGTRYHYKVRAYVVIDGKTYFSDFSNKAYRIAK